MVLSVWVLFVRLKMVSPKTENLAPVFLNLRSAPDASATLAQRMPDVRDNQSYAQAANLHV